MEKKIILFVDIHDKYFEGRRGVGTKEKGEFRKEFEKVAIKFKTNNRHFNPLSSRMSVEIGNGGGEKAQLRGWMGLKFY